MSLQESVEAVNPPSHSIRFMQRDSVATWKVLAHTHASLSAIKPSDVDKITGLSPVISIEQKTTNRNPRSTVDTLREYVIFWVFFMHASARLFLTIPEGSWLNSAKKEMLRIVWKILRSANFCDTSSLVRGRKGHYRELFEDIRKKGFVKVRVDGEVKDLPPDAGRPVQDS